MSAAGAVVVRVEVDYTLQMQYENSFVKFTPGDLVRFTDERLAMLATADRKRLQGRVGLVQAYWNFTRKLTVAFPEDAGRSGLRILSVDPRQLERVAENVVDNRIEPVVADDGVGDAKLSQEDTDNLFG